MFTDGYADQFGGSEDKKYMIQKLISLIKEIHEKPMTQQKMFLNKTLNDWMSHMKPYGEYYKQVDDILVLRVTITDNREPGTNLPAFPFSCFGP